MLKPGDKRSCGVCDRPLEITHVLSCSQCKEPVCSDHARIVNGVAIGEGLRLSDVVCSICFVAEHAPSLGVPVREPLDAAVAP